MIDCSLVTRLDMSNSHLQTADLEVEVDKAEDGSGRGGVRNI